MPRYRRSSTHARALLARDAPSAAIRIYVMAVAMSSSPGRLSRIIWAFITHRRAGGWHRFRLGADLLLAATVQVGASQTLR